MNTKQNSNLKKGLTALKLGVLAVGISSAFANSDYIEDQFSGEIPIDIDGSFEAFRKFKVRAGSKEA